MLEQQPAELEATTFKRLNQQVREYIDRVQPPDSLVLVLTAVIIGVGTGLGAVVFVWALDQVGAFVGWLEGQVGEILGLLLAMGIAGLLVGYVVERWAREAKGHGVPEVMEAIALRNGRIRPRVASLKVLASSLTIGTGGSAGREGPIVQVGSALGSTVGQILHFSADRVRTLVACGAAAGIAATFNAPIAGSIFALEVILGRFTVRYFGAVVISSVSASIIGRIFLSDKPAFDVPAYPFQPSELPLYTLLGILAALVAVLFIRSLYWFENLFDEWSWHPAYKAAVGMLLTAVVGLLLPGREVLGPGLHFIGEAIAEDIGLSVGLMFVLLILKLLTTCFTLGSGNSGGVFAPGLFMGALVGGMVGTVAHGLWPELARNPGAYAIVGMAAVFSAAARAPITAVLIVFEMSNDYQLILPLMLASVLSTLLAEHLFSESIYTLKLKLKGITLQRGRDLDLLQSIKVSEVMKKDPYLVQEDMPVTQLGRFLYETHSHSFAVVDHDLKLIGMVSLSDYEKVADAANLDQLQVKDIATTGTILVAYDDEPLSDVIQRLAVRSVHKLPVVLRDQPNKVVGSIRRDDVVRAYNIALTRKNLDVDKMELRKVGQMELLEVELPANSRAVGQSVAHLARDLPHDCVIVFIRRNGSVLIPHGDTVLQPGDEVHAFLRESDEAQLRDCLLKQVEAV
ncbi:MAG: chloride channel protein [Ardenticatenaceae bacterium]|nr:chloride channel protein [Ardenticatenaceae bacterium]